MKKYRSDLQNNYTSKSFNFTKKVTLSRFGKKSVTGLQKKFHKIFNEFLIKFKEHCFAFHFRDNAYWFLVVTTIVFIFIQPRSTLSAILGGHKAAALCYFNAFCRAHSAQTIRQFIITSLPAFNNVYLSFKKKSASDYVIRKSLRNGAAPLSFYYLLSQESQINYSSPCAWCLVHVE